MQSRLTIAIGLMAGFMVAACSKPSAENTPAAGAPPQSRDLRLAADPSGESRVVSDLEAGRLSRPSLSQPVARRPALKSASRAPEKGLADAELTAPTITSITAVSERSSQLAQVLLPLPLPLPLPMSAGRLPAAATGGEGSADHRDRDWGGISRGPMIIIRGGMGGPRDDCKILGARGAGGGILINSMAPRPGGEGRMPRSMPGPVRIR